MTKSIFNLLVIVTIVLYVSFGTILLIKHKKEINNIPDLTNHNTELIVNDNKPIDKKNFLDVKNFGYYIKDPNLSVIYNSPFDLMITDYDSVKKDQMDKLKLKQDKSRRIMISYVSLGMAENYRDYWKKEWNKTPPSFISRENNLWKGNFVIKTIDSSDWWKITTYMLDTIIDKKFDGILIGGIDSYTSDNNLESRRKMVDYIIKVNDYVKKKNKNFIVLVQNSEELTNDDGYTKSIDGILKEDLVYTWKSNGNTGPKTPITELNKSVEYLRTFRLKNKLVFVVEYVSEDSWKYAEQIIDKNGFIGYSAPRELNVLRIQ